MARRDDLLEIVRKKFGIDVDNDPEVLQWTEPMNVAQLAYDARAAAGLTQAALAEKLGATADDIESLEMADYDGDSLMMLARIARALGQQVEIRLTQVAEPETVG